MNASTWLGPHNGEVAVVERRHFVETETLGRGDNRGVGPTEGQVCVALDQQLSGSLRTMPTPTLIAAYVLDRVRQNLAAIALFVGESCDEVETQRLVETSARSTTEGLLGFQLLTAALENQEEQEDAETRAPEALDAQGWKALATGNLSVAMGIGDQLLQQSQEVPEENWNYGNLLHDGHIIKGYALLRDGDVAGATAQLEAAGQTPGSPQLNSFGPDIGLAWELLQRGRDDAVLAYFHDISRFWSPMGRLRLLESEAG